MYKDCKKGTNMNIIHSIYEKLYSEYGPQGWWPFINYNSTNDNKTGNQIGYHILDYTFPKNKTEQFEVCLASILTQNTTFTSVIKSLQNLNDLNALTPASIKKLDLETFKVAIRPSGYYNQKSTYILGFIDFYEKLQDRIPTREELLSVKGIGEETADSILLYAYNMPQFKVDAYTKRILTELKIIKEKTKYKDVKEIMESNLKKTTSDIKELTIIYQEYHALIVEHSKRYYSKKPYAKGCFLKEMFQDNITYNHT